MSQGDKVAREDRRFPAQVDQPDQARGCAQITQLGAVVVSRAGCLGSSSVSLRATQIALTFADYLDAGNRVARRYGQLQLETTLFIEEIERVSGTPVSLICTRFDSRSVIDRHRGYGAPAAGAGGVASVTAVASSRTSSPSARASASTVKKLGSTLRARSSARTVPMATDARFARSCWLICLPSRAVRMRSPRALAAAR